MLQDYFKTLILDPAGKNVLLYAQDHPAYSGRRREMVETFNQNWAVRGPEERLHFDAPLVCTTEEFRNLERVWRRIDRADQDTEGNEVSTVVIYNFLHPYSEDRAIRMRHIVPSALATNPHLLQRDDNGDGTLALSYYILQQGRFEYEASQLGTWWEIDFKFTETDIRFQSEES